jgi:Co/Zn/Cd efflux system component
VRERILAVPGVVGVHDLHAWQITAGLPMITAHVIAADGADPARRPCVERMTARTRDRPAVLTAGFVRWPATFLPRPGRR